MFCSSCYVKRYYVQPLFVLWDILKLIGKRICKRCGILVVATQQIHMFAHHVCSHSLVGIIDFFPHAQVDMYEAGELDYRKIRGGTGPLVYPAGFLYLYSFLKSATNNGTNVFQAQVYFIFIYIWNTAIVLMIYSILARRMTTYCTIFFSTSHFGLELENCHGMLLFEQTHSFHFCLEIIQRWTCHVVTVLVNIVLYAQQVENRMLFL